MYLGGAVDDGADRPEPAATSGSMGPQNPLGPPPLFILSRDLSVFRIHEMDLPTSSAGYGLIRLFPAIRDVIG
jgi:hypothetical protein